MRFPNIHIFLKWAGPTLVFASAGFVGLVFTASSLWPRVKQWAEDWYFEFERIVTLPLFILLAALLICGYIWALIYTGGQRKRGASLPIVDKLMKRKKIKMIENEDKPGNVVSHLKSGGANPEVNIGTINQNNSPNSVGVNMGTVNQNQIPSLEVIKNHGWQKSENGLEYIVEVKIRNPGGATKVRIIAPTDVVARIVFIGEGIPGNGQSGATNGERWAEFLTPNALQAIAFSGDKARIFEFRAEFE